MNPSIVTLKPYIHVETGALHVMAYLGPDDDIDLNSLTQLSDEKNQGTQVILYATDFVIENNIYRVFGATLTGRGMVPWAVSQEGACYSSFTLPAPDKEGPRFMLCAVPDHAEKARPLVYVSSGSGFAGSLPINVGKPGGPGQSAG